MEFAIWSRILRETVQYYGRSGNDGYRDKDNNLEWVDEGMEGPFYCGMSFVMVIPSFNIRLCAPTSTSKQVEVATRFGGDEGIIIQLNLVIITSLFRIFFVIVPK